MEQFTKKIMKDATQNSFLFRRTYLAVMCWYSENKTDYFQMKQWIENKYSNDFKLEINYVNHVLSSNDRSELAISRHLAKKIKYEFQRIKNREIASLTI